MPTTIRPTSPFAGALYTVVLARCRARARSRARWFVFALALTAVLLTALGLLLLS